jgi:hypothetical protein
VCAIVRDSLPGLLDAESTALFILDDASGELWTPVGDLALDPPQSPTSVPPSSSVGLPPVVRVAAGAGIAGAAVQARAPVYVAEAYDDPRFVASEKLTSRLRSLLCVPRRVVG